VVFTNLKICVAGTLCFNLPKLNFVSENLADPCANTLSVPNKNANTNNFFMCIFLIIKVNHQLVWFTLKFILQFRLLTTASFHFLHTTICWCWCIWSFISLSFKAYLFVHAIIKIYSYKLCKNAIRTTVKT